MTLDSLAIADIQSASDHRKLRVNQVGIRALRHPIYIENKRGEAQPTIAFFNMYVDLPHHVKGTHMSRFIEILNSRPITLGPENFIALLDEVSNKLAAETAFLEIRFPFFVTKFAPVSKAASVMDYEVCLIGTRNADKSNIILKVLIPVTSLCPCSKDISEYGAHNQRSHVTITAEIRSGLWIEDLIEYVEKEASAALYGILKRPDEKYVTEQAYNHPKFVEDMVRDVARHLLEDDRIGSFTVESENFESIHNHSAYAMISREKN